LTELALLKKEGGIQVLLAASKKGVQEVASLQPLGHVLVVERLSGGGGRVGVRNFNLNWTLYKIKAKLGKY